MRKSREELIRLAQDIPVVILAGGLGTRLAEETASVPKPMVEIGGLPIILHLMDSYARFGFSKFVICGGYKIEVIKNYCLNLPFVGKDVEVNFSEGMHEVNTSKSKYVPGRHHWHVTVLETGMNSMTGARVRKAMNYLQSRNFQRLCLTYGDGLTDVDFHEELDAHLEHGNMGTVLGVHQPTRFGIFEFDKGSKITKFAEKPKFSNEYINGGFFIFERAFEKYLPQNDDDCVFEKGPLEELVAAGNLHVFKHDGFWQCMDTKREKTLLEDMLLKGEAPWLQAVPND